MSNVTQLLDAKSPSLVAATPTYDYVQQQTLLSQLRTYFNQLDLNNVADTNALNSQNTLMWLSGL
jgi:hypothetical protein